MKAQVVIGANWGDEGKGLCTDFLASRGGGGAIVVRHNGGAQAGHTVQTPVGQRHVFSHFGSGSFAGAATWLSRFFISAPLLFCKEWSRLETLGVAPLVYVDPNSLVTTPYDMLVNQMAEVARGSANHGSVGVGFGETIERSLHPEFALTVADLDDSGRLAGRLQAIRQRWVPARLEALRVHAPDQRLMEVLESPMLLEDFLAACRFFLRNCTRAGVEALSGYESVIFEGAQGLLLDEEHRFFPHVTRSKTGVRNAAILAKEAGIDELELFYMTRAYATRHGVGPMPHELAEKPYPGIDDATNIPNPWQGSLRFGALDLDLLAESIAGDLRETQDLRYSLNLGVTCLDQVPEQLSYVVDGRLRLAPKAQLLAELRSRLAPAQFLLGFGPTRETLMACEAVSLDEAANGRVGVEAQAYAA